MPAPPARIHPDASRCRAREAIVAFVRWVTYRRRAKLGDGRSYATALANSSPPRIDFFSCQSNSPRAAPMLDQLTMISCFRAKRAPAKRFGLGKISGNGFTAAVRPIAIGAQRKRTRSSSYFGCVEIGQVSVRNGVAGRPARFHRLTFGLLDQPNRTDSGLETPAALTTIVSGPVISAVASTNF